MDVTPRVLRKETVLTLNMIEIQIRQVEDEAAEAGVMLKQVTDANGSHKLAPLLLAKAQCLNTLVLLQGK